MNHSHRHIPLLILAFCVACVVGALYLYVYRTIGVSVERANVARDAALLEQNDASHSKTLADLVSSTANDRARLPSLLISSDAIVSFITSLEALGPESGTALTIASIDSDVTGTSVTGSVGHVHAHVDAHGSWQSVMHLIGLVETSDSAVEVSHVRMSQTSIDGRNMWSTSFEADGLVLVHETALPARQ